MKKLKNILPLLAGLFCALSANGQALSGTYTIGGNSPSYFTFTDAVTDLKSKGVSGPVVFNVRADVYFERISIDPVAGASATNTIVFKGESGDKTGVKLMYEAAGAADRATVFLNGADHITFRDMTITALNNAQGVGIWMTNLADYNSFINLDIIVDSTTPAQNVSGIVASGNATSYAGGNSANHTLLDSLHINGGYYGLYMRGTSTTSYCNGNTIRNSSFRSQYYYPIYFQSQSRLTVFNNRTAEQDRLNITPRLSLYTTSCSNIEIGNNFFTGGGIALLSTNRSLYDAGFRSVLYNNMVISVNSYAVQVDGTSSNISLLHNSLVGNSATSSAIAVYGAVYVRDGAQQIDLRNNLVYNGSSGATLHIENINAFSHLDHNNYAPPAAVAFIEGDSYASLSDMRAVFPQLNHWSVSVNPYFISADNIYTSARAEGVYGAAHTGINKDIAGNERNPLYPALGAHELPYNTKNSIKAVRFLSPAIFPEAGTHTVKVEIANTGKNKINNLKAEWSVNGIMQAPVTVASIDTAGSTAGNVQEVSLANVDFPLGGRTEIRVWSSLPTGMNDAYGDDDTLTFYFYTPLSGAYTIGGNEPDFKTFSQAAFILNRAGIAGPVSFDIRPGTYTEAVLLNVIPGASATSTVLFKGAGKERTVLTYSGSNIRPRTVLMNGTDHVTFRDMSVEITGNYPAFWLTNNADSNRFINLNINLPLTSTSTSSAGITLTGSLTSVNAPGASCNDNLFDSLRITGGYYGICTNGTNTSSSHSLRNTISNSAFTQQYYYPLLMNAQSYLTISNNTISGTRLTTTDYALRIQNSSGITVANNRIFANGHGIALENVNRYLEDTDFISQVYNNMISLSGSTSASATGHALSGIYARHVKIWHNSFRSESTNSHTLHFDNSCSGLDIRNNHVFSNNSTAGVYSFNAITAAAFDVLDHNNYYSPAGLANIAGAAYPDLPSLKAGLPQFNQNSYHRDPNYIAPDNLYLDMKKIHLTGEYLGVSRDIDGNVRPSAKPAIGAYELFRNPNDAGLYGFTQPVAPFCEGKYPLQVFLANVGTNPLESVEIHWEIDGEPQKPVSVNTLVPVPDIGNTLEVVLDSVFFGKKFKAIKAWSVRPNGVADNNKSNDTISISLGAGLNGNYTIGGSSPDFSNFNEAAAYLNNFGVCGPVIFNVRAGVYEERVVIGEIDGASAINTITFKGKSRSNVILTNYGQTEKDQATVLLNGTDHIVFRDMTVEATGPVYGTTFWLTNNADSNSFINMDILADTLNTLPLVNGIVLSGSTVSAVGGEGAGGSRNLFDNLLVRGGYVGINLRGSGTGTTNINNSYNTVQHCIFPRQHHDAVYAADQNYLTLKNNKVPKSLTGTVVSYAFYLTRVNNIEISGNEITNTRLSSGSQGIYTSSVNVVAQGLRDTNFVSRIYNNTIHAANPLNLAGQTNYVKVLHNSLKNNSTVPSIQVAGTSFITVKNNHFQNNGPAGTALTGTLSAIDTLDFNNYYSAGPVLVSLGAQYPDLATLKAGLPQFNQNSYSADPGFVSENDLRTTFDLPGTYSGIGHDLDGNPRCLSAPAIGASEITDYTLDKPLRIYPSADTVFVRSPLRFTSNFISSGNRKISYLWNIDGLEYTEAESDHVFYSPQDYNVTLKAGNCLNSDSTGILLQAYQATSSPQADFHAPATVVKDVIHDEIQLYDLSKHGPSSWEWSSGNSNVYFYPNENAQNPRVVFSYPGFYEICLKASNSLGEGTTLCKPMYITVQDKIGLCSERASSSAYIGELGSDSNDYTYKYDKNCTFLIDPPCPESGVSLKINRLEFANVADRLLIYNGKNSSSPLIAQLSLSSGAGSGEFFAASGSMYLEWKTEKKEAGSRLEASWHSYPDNNPVLPVADFQVPDTVYTYQRVRFTSSSTGKKLNYIWDFDTLASVQSGELGGNQETDIYSWETPGTYDVKLFVHSDCGETDSLVKQVIVADPTSSPEVDFYAAQLKIPLLTSVSLHDISKFAPDAWEWEITPAGSVLYETGSSGQEISVSFTAPGSYTVKLKASNELGADSAEKTAYIEVFDYCLPQVSILSQDIGISQVQYGNISHFSPVGVSRYSNYFSLYEAPEVEKTRIFTVLVKRHTNGDLMSRKIWVDWNQDGSFDDASELAAFETPARTLSYLAAITVPASAREGLTVMRIGTALEDGINQPCGLNRTGEFEDYPLEIILPGPKAPQISLHGNNPDSIAVFSSYTDPGAAATDFLGNDISASVTVSGNLDKDVTGNYMLWYTARDMWGNIDSAGRIIKVYDNVPPQITSDIPDTLFVEVFSGLNAPSITAVDNYHSTVAISVDSSMVNTSLTGVYSLTYTASDLSGNISQAVVWVKVEDTQRPVITLEGEEITDLEVHAGYEERGVSVSDNYCAGMSWEVSGSVNASVLGEYMLVYSATDCNGNEALPVTRKVRVLDRTAPVVALRGGEQLTIARWQDYTDSGYVLQDNYYAENAISVATFGSWESSSEEGLYYIQYRATDPSGNTGWSEKRFIDVRGSNSIRKAAELENIGIYPNPSRGSFNIDLGADPEMKTVISIYDMAGKLLILTSGEGQKIHIHAEKLNPGFYLVRIQNDKGTASRKISIVH